MKFFIRAAAKSPYVTAVIIWAAVKLHVVDGKELVILITAMNSMTTV